jgi:hypothetical protein
LGHGVCPVAFFLSPQFQLCAGRGLIKWGNKYLD